MRIRNKAVSVGKICLLVILLLVGLTVLGCLGIKTAPEGGSGGTIADGTIFLCPALKQAAGFGCAAPTVEGKLVAVDISDGSRLWEAPLEASAPAGGGFGCAPTAVPVAIYGNPAVAGDLVYVGGYNGRVYAINSDSGALRWEYPRGASNLEPIVSGVVIALDRLYFGCSDGKVYALDIETGDLQPGFPFETGDKIWATPVIDGETLYIGSFDKKLYAIDIETGEEKWEFETEGSIACTPLVYNNTVYFGSFDRYFYAVDAASGSLKWKSEVEAGSWFWTRAAVYDDVVYVGCFDGKVYVLDAETGDEVVDAIDLGSPIYSWPVLVESRVIVATEEGEIYAIDTANNQAELLADLEEVIYAPLCASDGVIYIYSLGQNLYALNAESGARLWSQTIE